MTEDDLRRLVRESVARALHQRAGGASPARVLGRDPAHARFHLPGGDESDDGRCLIEPAVRCNHCGYCQSYGH